MRFIRRYKSQKMTTLTGWVVRYDGFHFGSNCFWGKEIVVHRCRAWGWNSGSTCPNHLILCQTNRQHHSNHFSGHKNLRLCVIFGFLYYINSWWSVLLKSKPWNLQPRTTPKFFSVVSNVKLSKSGKRIIEFGSLPPLWRHFRLKNDQVWGLKCTTPVLSRNPCSMSIPKRGKNIFHAKI